MRREFIIGLLAVIALLCVGAYYYPPTLWSLVFLGPIILIGVNDFFQTKHTIRRNFPIVGNFRYLFEAIRPEINQYFVESNTDGVPFSREQRSLVYQRSKGTLDTLPFGTQRDVYEVGFEWLNHSLHPVHVNPESLRVKVGGPDCTQPYLASVMNISAMSYGALSSNAVLSLNGGARDGGFAHNTGEGGMSSYHLKNGGDLIWQIGTGYFGCRSGDGRFNPDKFAEKAKGPSIKMIEIKLSQGAKPGHGGILPAAKVTPEISKIREVPMGQDVLSPPAHSAFGTPLEMLQFIKQLRELSGGKPVGFKLCLGKRREFLAICKAMHKTGITPDFITVDGAEGGTGAAPLEFSNHIGTPLVEALIFVHNSLVGFNLRDRVRVIAAGKVTSGFGIVKRLALGADMVYSARAFMMSLGCIQALRCHNNSCPTGVATQDRNLASGLHVPDKRHRVATFHKETIESAAEILGAMGVEKTEDLRPWHLMRRISPMEVKHYGELYEYLNPGDLLRAELPVTYKRACQAASPDSFRHSGAEI
ncbi:MAG: FMN-binding glutamate synthase family protein [Bdellovibrionaceae bacterium]|nr:FMN-binding glutamate synthase family protein [Bdellovibrionales bacterium]MCB9085020.1 FMN-binding glutamate synthase family protein [Pseudobdellovibrionaceae bacterium]